MKLATPRKELVAECCRAAMVYHAMGMDDAARAWIAKARQWRANYAAEIEANNAWIRANPEQAKRHGLTECAPCPEARS